MRAQGKQDAMNPEKIRTVANTSVVKPSNLVWFVFFFSACFLFYKYLLQISPSVMTHDLMRTYTLSGKSLGFLVGLYYFTYLIMQIPSGILLDKYGERLFTTISILLCACGALLFSLTNSFALACVARLMIGFGAAFATTSYMKIASKWFAPHYFPLLSGLFGAACMAGAATAEAPLAYLVNGVGWRDTMKILAILGFILGALFWLFVNDKKRTHLVSTTPLQTPPFRYRDLMRIIRNRSNWPLILYGGFAFTPIAVFGGLWGVPYLLAAYSLPKTVAAASVSLVFLGFSVGGVVIGWIGKCSTRLLPIIITGTVGAFVFFIIILYVPHMPLWLLNSCIFLFGFGGSSFLLSYAIAKNINSAALVGTVIGVINMGDPLCGAFAEPMIGKILDLYWTGITIDNVRIFSVHAYQLGLSLLTLYLVLALLCCCFIKESPKVSSIP